MLVAMRITSALPMFISSFDIFLLLFFMTLFFMLLRLLLFLLLLPLHVDVYPLLMPGAHAPICASAMCDACADEDEAAFDEASPNTPTTRHEASRPIAPGRAAAPKIAARPARLHGVKVCAAFDDADEHATMRACRRKDGDAYHAKICRYHADEAFCRLSLPRPPVARATCCAAFYAHYEPCRAPH